MNLIERKMQEWKGDKSKPQLAHIRLIYDTLVGPPGLKNGHYVYSPDGYRLYSYTPQSDANHFSAQPKAEQKRIEQALKLGHESGLLALSLHGSIGRGFTHEYILAHVLADEMREFLESKKHHIDKG